MRQNKAASDPTIRKIVDWVLDKGYYDVDASRVGAIQKFLAEEGLSHIRIVRKGDMGIWEGAPYRVYIPNHPLVKTKLRKEYSSLNHEAESLAKEIAHLKEQLKSRKERLKLLKKWL